MVVRTVIGWRNGVNVFIVPKEITVRDIKKWKEACDELPNGDGNYQKYFRAWFMELPDHCCCE